MAQPILGAGTIAGINLTQRVCYMAEEHLEGNVVYWPRVKEILDGIMRRWEERWGRDGLPGVHRYYWDSPQQLAEDVLSGVPAIEPGIPGHETQFVRSLARSVGSWGRMPLHGPFLPKAEIDEIAAWIDAGMPECPPEN